MAEIAAILMNHDRTTDRLAIFIPSLHRGGAERIVVNLLKGIVARGVDVDLVLADARGSYFNQVPTGVRVVDLRAGRVTRSIIPLARYLRNERPRALVSHLSHANITSVIARAMVRSRTLLILVEHNTRSLSRNELQRERFIPPLARLLYPRSDAVVAVSQGVAHDLESMLKLEPDSVDVIYNPVVDEELLRRAEEPINHPWFGENEPPVFVAAGRLTYQKGFDVLIRAFAEVRKQTNARLLIMGEGEERVRLESLIRDLGLEQDLDLGRAIGLPGFIENPYPSMRHSAAFVLSSRWEGLPTVLIEAMACGARVISTDCPSGPREILGDHASKVLVDVDDPVGLAGRMINALDSDSDSDEYVERALEFSVDRAAEAYLELAFVAPR